MCYRFFFFFPSLTTWSKHDTQVALFKVRLPANETSGHICYPNWLKFITTSKVGHRFTQNKALRVSGLKVVKQRNIEKYDSFGKVNDVFYSVSSILSFFLCRCALNVGLSVAAQRPCILSCNAVTRTEVILLFIFTIVFKNLSGILLCEGESERLSILLRWLQINNVY